MCTEKYLDYPIRTRVRIILCRQHIILIDSPIDFPLCTYTYISTKKVTADRYAVYKWLG